MARFIARIAGTSALTFGGRAVKDIRSRMVAKSYTVTKPMLGNLDTLTELFYRYIKVMRPEDTDAINLAFVGLRR